MTNRHKSLGQIAYDSYFEEAGGRRLSNWSILLQWERDAWEQAAAKVMEAVIEGLGESHAFRKTSNTCHAEAEKK